VSLKFLEDALEERSKAFRGRLRRGLGRSGRPIDKDVRKLRTSARRLLSILAAVERIGSRKSARRLERRVDRILGRLGPLRDLTVQREMLALLEPGADSAALRRFRHRVERGLRRSARKTRRWLERSRADVPKSDQRRILRKLRQRRAQRHDAQGRRELSRQMRSTFDELRARRAAVDPSRVDTVHKMRIGLKTFRYQIEALKALVPGVSKEALDALHTLQTTMGDIHDIEVLSSSLVEFAKDDPDRTAELAPLLARLEASHSEMLQSFLRSADPILRSWQGALA
jgi:CHAD domain-containing protein